MRFRPTLGAATASVAVGLMAVVVPPASAHVRTTPEQVPVGDLATVSFTVPNECAGSTSGFRVELPDGATEVTPASPTGWTGAIATSLPPSVAWTGGKVSGKDKVVFGLSLRLGGEVGDIVYFPSVQTCSDGEQIRWLDIPADPSAPEPKSPAPSVELVSGSGVAPPEPSTTSTLSTTSTVPATTTTVEPRSGTAAATIDEDSPWGIVIVVAAVVLAIAGIAVAISRRGRNGSDRPS